MGFRDCARGTGHDAAAAASAARRLREVGRQFERRQDLRQEKPGAEFGIDQHRAFAVPAYTGCRGVVPFEDRARVDVIFLDTAASDEKAVQLLQFPEHQVVVIVSPGIASDPSSRGASQPRLFPLPVIERHDNYRANAREDLFRIASFLLTPAHPCHLARRSFAQPGAKLFSIPGRRSRCNFARIKPKGRGPVDDFLLQVQRGRLVGLIQRRKT